MLGLPSTEALMLFILLTLARPLGLLFGFIVFPWGLRQSFMLRVGLALTISLPMSIAIKADIVALAETMSTFELVMLVIKEFSLGYALGFIASLPLLALQYAGAITDSYRGDSGSGHSDPMGGNIGAWSTFFIIIGLIVFVAGDGLQQVIAALYDSYTAWPLPEMLPPLPLLSAGILLDLVGQTLKSAVIVAAPLLFTLMALELALAIGSRISQRFQLMSIEFALKNLAAALLLPAMTVYILAYLAGEPVDFSRVLGVLQIILP